MSGLLFGSSLIKDKIGIFSNKNKFRGVEIWLDTTGLNLYLRVKG